MDTLRTKDVRHTHTLVIEHLASVRRIRGMEDATAVLCLESNLAFEAQHLIHAFERAKVRKWVALSEGAAGAMGWLTTVRRPRNLRPTTAHSPPAARSFLRRMNGRR